MQRKQRMDHPISSLTLTQTQTQLSSYITCQALCCAGKKLELVKRSSQGIIWITRNTSHLHIRACPFDTSKVNLQSSQPIKSAGYTPYTFESYKYRMVKLKEVEDEHFAEKPATTKSDALLESDDDDDYTDTGMNFQCSPNPDMIMRRRKLGGEQFCSSKYLLTTQRSSQTPKSQ